MIEDQAALEAFCERARSATFLTVDTEFVREKTYYPQLCLVQVATDDEAVAIDPLAEGVELSPLFALMNQTTMPKVFHAAGQDLEIFANLSGALPSPLFDTQIAAMVCGFGDSVSYQALVAKLAKGRIDKSSRFTDWARRPLTERQVRYALDDVRYLRAIYEKLAERLERTGRRSIPRAARNRYSAKLPKCARSQAISLAARSPPVSIPSRAIFSAPFGPTPWNRRIGSSATKRAPSPGRITHSPSGLF